MNESRHDLMRVGGKITGREEVKELVDQELEESLIHLLKSAIRWECYWRERNRCFLSPRNQEE